MAIAYQYNANGYFVGQVDDYGLCPNNATNTPPTLTPGFIPRWAGAAWVMDENHVGETGWLADGTPHTVKDYGPLPKGFTKTEPPKPKPTVGEAKAAALAKLATKRWEVETKGITVQGLAIPTDRESQALITGAATGALLDPAQVVRWKTGTTDPNGAPVTLPLDAESVKMVAQAVRAHVQACFDAEMDKAAALVKLGTLPAIAEWEATILKAGWPGAE